MITFYSDYDYLESDIVTLKISEKNEGNGVILPFYYYDIFNKKDEAVGKISIRIGSNFHSYFNGHIGYEIFESHRGNHFAYEAAKLVLQVAKAHKMTELYLTCRQSNIASVKTMIRLGAIKKEVAKIPREYLYYYDGIEDHCIYHLMLTDNRK